MSVSMTITGEDEVDFRRALCRLAAPYLQDFLEVDFAEPTDPETAEPPPAAQASPPPTEPAQAAEPKKGGRPKGSTNKPKTNGSGAEPPQTEAAQPQPTPGQIVEVLPLTEQIQIITDAAHDHPEKFKPLLVPLREKLGVQYISKALEKDRPTLQTFIHEHGLAV